MPLFSKTIYVEVEADSEQQAEDQVQEGLSSIVMNPENPITHVDFEGPIEETPE